MIQLVGVELKLRLAFQNDVVLVHLRIHGADLPLAERVIKCVIDGGGRDAQAGGGNAVDHQRYSETASLLIGGNVFQFRQLLEPRDETIGPLIQLIHVGVFERVLVLRPAHAVVDGDVLHGLHKQLDSLNLIQFRLEPANHVGCADIPLIERLEIDRHPAAVEGGIRAIGADKGGQALDGGVLQNDLGKLLLLLWPSRRTDCFEACEIPWITPVSCTGKNPLGMMM